EYVQMMSLNVGAEDPTDIDWLSSELDDLESFSSNISITDKENSDYDIDESNIHIDFGNDQCVITEVIDGKLKKCSNPTFRSIKQMMGIWELDFDTVDGILKQRSDYAYTLQFLGVCSSHFNFDQDGLHTRGSKIEVADAHFIHDQLWNV
ncbi:828_t:CDS:2, partial [Ambispora gerdemannii]